MRHSQDFCLFESRHILQKSQILWDLSLHFKQELIVWISVHYIFTLKLSTFSVNSNI